MSKSYKSHSFFYGLKFSCINSLKANKVKVVVSFSLILIAICTGIFVAIKYNNAYNLCQLQEIDIDDFYSGIAGSSSAFLSRSLSLCVNVLLLSLLAFSPFLLPLAEVLFVYRGYLFGLNFALMVIFYGLGGAITAIVVVLPCQLCIIAMMVMFFLVLQKINSNSKKFGCADCNRILFVLIFLLLLLAVNLIETVLLFVLNGKVIMVI